MKVVFLDLETLGEDVDLGVFDEFGEVETHMRTDYSETIERIKDAEVVVTNKVLIDKKIMDACENLKLVCIAATGTNNVDLEYAREKNIAVSNVQGYSTDSVAQHTFALLFQILGNIRMYDEYVRSGEYERSKSFTYLRYPFFEIKNKTWGIIGLGNIGRRVAEIAEVFGARVIYFSASGKDYESKYERKRLKELLSESDIVSLHTSLNENTKGLIKYQELKEMKKDGIIINVARGGIIDENDLARALDENLLAAAATDVLVNEPIEEDNPLLKINDMNKIIITPHIAWSSKEARKTLMREIHENIEAYKRGDKRNRV